MKAPETLNPEPYTTGSLKGLLGLKWPIVPDLGFGK